MMEKQDSSKPFVQHELEKLKQSSALVESLIDGVNYGLAVIAPDYTVIEANSRMRAWFGEPDTSAAARCHSCFYLQAPAPCPNCPGAQCLASGTKQSATLERTTADGSRCFKISCTPLKGPGGGILGFLEIAEDVTAESRMKRMFRQREARYMQIIENASDAIITFTGDGIIEHINRKAGEFSGYAGDELIGETIYTLMPAGVREQQKKALSELLDEDNVAVSKIIEGQFLKKDGSSFPVEETLSVQRTAGGCIITTIIRDVSARKTYERNLQHQAAELAQEVADRTRQLATTEERYRALVDTANDAIISTDSNGTILYCNKRAEVMHGYIPGELAGRHITAIVPAGIWDEARSALQQAPADSGGRIIESQATCKSGSSLPVEVTVSVFQSDDQKHVAFIVRDISRRKQLEKALHEYTAKLEEKVRGRTYELTASQQNLKEKVTELSILKEISEALASAMELDDVLNIILVGATSHHGLGFNRAFLFLLSEDGHYLEGKVAIGPSDSNEAQKIWGEIMGKDLTLGEILQTYLNRAGKIDTYVNQLIQSIRIPRDEQENILIQSVCNRLSYNIRDGYNHPQVPRSLLALMNTNAFCLTPLMVEENVLGVLWADNTITQSPIGDRDLERLRAFGINASLAIEKSNLYKNIQSKVDALDIANRELKENRDRLIRSEKLAAVGQMSATVAHGIRNPLVSIGGFARRLLKKEAEGSDNRKYLQIIVDEIDRLEIILSELLDFVRPRKLTLQTVAINELLENTLEVFVLEFEKHGVTIDRQFADGLPELEIDSDQFKRVLHNLFNNAMDAMPQGGALRLTTSPEDTMVKISIADSGEGIETNDIEKVFHPFFTSKASGSGLGLAVCNQIISIHGGHIKLRRQLPQGMVFDIYLPAPAQPDESQAEQPGAGPADVDA